MIEVIFIFEDAYSFGDMRVEELRRWVPAIPRKGDHVDFTDHLYTMDEEGKMGGGEFYAENVSFFMHKDDGEFEGIVISLIPAR